MLTFCVQDARVSTIPAVAGSFTRALRRHRGAFCAVLIEAREEASLTQRDLAARLRVPRTTVSRVELGERRLDVLELLLWAKAIGIAPNTLFARVLRRLGDIAKP